MTLILKTKTMKNLTIKRQENKTIETNVVYDLPAFFQRDNHEKIAVYSEDKVVRIQYFETLGIGNFAVKNVDTFKSGLAESKEITEREFFEVFDKAIVIVEQASCLAYGRLAYDELQDRESEMRDIEMEVNEARGEMEC